jgi:hypothetical protein
LSSERIKQAAHTNGSVLDDDLLADPEIMVRAISRQSWRGRCIVLTRADLTCRDAKSGEI